MSLYHDYMNNMGTLKCLAPSGIGRVVTFIILGLIVVSVAMLHLTPWVQTAQGFGIVSTVSPEDRRQAISALVSGQIEKWHVQEGQFVNKGDPIVTLRDQDSELIARLHAELISKQQEMQAAEIALNAAELDFTRQQNLLEQGLVSPRQRDQNQIKLQEAKAKLASTEAAINQAETRLARQSRQTKTAPQAGVITQLLSAGVATIVSEGDVLARFIPKSVKRSVVIKINGLDAPLVQPGRDVRLQFDGWPVFQFSGWPSIAVGTFGGKVNFVEPMANPDGTFNVWIDEDPENGAWPDEQYVRLGSQARAWVLLEEVKLGYEMWRQLNNFPPNYPQDIITE
ncbi:HlyD family efflux transporter periplasmic adaptor subunit [Alteromonas sp. 5E99-2]|uniref:efflux RND transporter periplasmic adaptor subunit n=1 Tax=Alteromonas sp. 5E99-2 TaxID=2817683 RepID=UPI001A98F049|nr:HlyD family efflux transporter periplasmic adaptor subunit [Alteromonas sp. 5E99-2]MBO1254496.1 HlyD family efflux transporter periplasmic adaptor subunit [Alteromonas sp. 5E99-2]